MKSCILICLIILSPFVLLAQKEVTVNGMNFSYQLKKDYIEIELAAPTSGWVGVGFNAKNDIVNSDLFLFHIVNNKVEGRDMFVESFANPKDDTALGGTMDIKNLRGTEKDGKTKVIFELPFPSIDQYDFKHKMSKEFWLILAYSTHDDFDHHSAMRKHIVYKFDELD
ncbi:MAG: DOMON domain-containing protein [Bacteroidota bacterium]